ncbi:MAG: DUF5916 domain-containing protein [Pseudomonadales bacterium]
MERVLGLVVLLLIGAATRADIAVEIAPGEVLRLTRLAAVDGDIVIDGALNEAVWRQLPAYDPFVVIEPDTLTAPRHRTLIRLAYDDRGLYLGAEMHQPPETLIKRLSSRDDRALNRDSINLTLDTSGEGRYGFWFGVNLGDTLSDGTVLPERSFSNDWDGPWRGRSRETEFGWTAEFFIPWSTVSMPVAPGVRRMGLYMSRKVAYLEERWGWPALPDTVPRFMSVLQGFEMEGVAPRQQYNFYPFLGITQDHIDDEVRYRVGADVFWRPSTNFQLNATVNPDFGNVETDEVIINLSATETFFPEKRLFFLEGQEIFVASPRADTRGGGVGSSGAPYTMVNTRRIGGRPELPVLPPGSAVTARDRIQPVDLLGAAKVTGQLGALRYGVLGAFEDDVTLNAQGPDGAFRVRQDGNDYGIARVLYEDNPRGAYRALGFLSTAVKKPTGDALAHGIDWHYLTSNGKLKIDGQAMTSDIDGVGRGHGGFVDFEYTYRRGMVQRLGLEYFDEDFNINDLGFLERNDHYRLRSAFVFTRANLGPLRSNQLDIRGFLQKSISESLLNAGGIFISNRAEFRNLSRLTLRLHFLPGQYDDLNSFGNGTFRIDKRREAFALWESDSTRAVVMLLGGGFREENLGGDSWMAEAGVVWRPSDRFNLTMKLRYDDRDEWLLQQQDTLFATFQAEQWQPKLSADFFITARQQLRVSLDWVGIRAEEDRFLRVPGRPGGLIEVDKPVGPGFRPSYDFSVSQLNVQARYRWEIAPLSDIFLVYTRQADRRAPLGDDGFTDLADHAWNAPLQNLLVFKIRYRFGS